MGLPMFREPNPSDASKSTIKVNTDPTARARSYIRRHVMRRSAPRPRPDDALRSSTTNPSDMSPRMSPLRHSEISSPPVGGSPGDYRENAFDVAASTAYRWGVEPGSAEHAQLRDYLRSTTPLSRQSRRQHHRRTGEDRGSEDRRRILVLAQPERDRDRAVQPEQGIPPQVTISTSSGLGDRRRSPSPDDLAWETLRATIPPDERLPSASSSFTSASTSASLSRHRTTDSPATSIGAPGPVVSLYPSRPPAQLPTPPHPSNDDEFTSLFVCDSASTTDDEADLEADPRFARSPSSLPDLEVPPPDNVASFTSTIASPPRSPYPGTVSPAAISRHPPHPNELEPLSEPRRRDFLISRMRDREERATVRARARRYEQESSSRRERSPGRWSPSRMLDQSEREQADRNQIGSSQARREYARSYEPGRLSPLSQERRMELWRREHGRYGENLDIHEVHARYARLQAQEEHLNLLIDRLCRGRPVPERLWGLAGVERRGIEETARI